jgi:hypothetical protein
MTKYWIAFGLLIIATTLEASGDATIRLGLLNRTGAKQAATLLCGGLLVFGYGVMLNLAPLPFERIVGLYIATLFCVWQAVSFVTFRAVPTTPVLVGGALIIAGGLVVTFWNPAPV